MNGATNSQMMFTVITRLFPFCVPMMVWHTSFSSTICRQDIPAFVEPLELGRPNSQQSAKWFSTTCLGTPGRSTFFWAVHVRAGSPSHKVWLVRCVQEGSCGYCWLSLRTQSIYIQLIQYIYGRLIRAVRDWIHKTVMEEADKNSSWAITVLYTWN